MIAVVSDTSPLNYLIQIDCSFVLPVLFGSVIVHSQVLEELQRTKAPKKVQEWSLTVPSWVEIREGDPSRFPLLDYGEAAALGIAADEQAQLLVDDLNARLVATSLGVPISGTVGILAEAHLRSLVDFDIAMQALNSTSYRIHQRIVESARQRILDRQSQ